MLISVRFYTPVNFRCRIVESLNKVLSVLQLSRKSSCKACLAPLPADPFSIRQHAESHLTELGLCGVCGASFPDRDASVTHALAHVGVQLLACSMCRLQFCSQNKLLRHHHHAASGYSLPQEALLAGSQSPGSELQCAVCTKTLSRRFQVRTHQTGEDNYKYCSRGAWEVLVLWAEFGLFEYFGWGLTCKFFCINIIISLNGDRKVLSVRHVYITSYFNFLTRQSSTNHRFAKLRPPKYSAYTHQLHPHRPTSPMYCRDLHPVEAVGQNLRQFESMFFYFKIKQKKLFGGFSVFVKIN